MVNENLKNMSIEEKIGQKLIIGFDTNKDILPKIEYCIKNYKIGGVLLYKKNYKNCEDLIEKVQKIKEINKKYSKIPISISIDQEGGRVNRLPPEIEKLPSSYELANIEKSINSKKISNLNLKNAQKLGNPEDMQDMQNMEFITNGKDENIVSKSADVTSKILKDLGINMNFAPVLDIKNFSENHAIGDRAFSSNKEEVAKFGILEMKKMQENGIISVIKHFPGHGATKIDSHFALPIIKHKNGIMNSDDIVPFKKAIENGADTLLVGHLLIRKLTGMYPSTMSKKIVNILRKDLQFKGVIVTDDMRMKGVKILYGKYRAIKKAFLAGNDIMMVKFIENDKIYNKLKKLVEKKRIEERELNLSVERILELKNKYNISDDITLNKTIDIEGYNTIIREIKKQKYK